jgi:hypothetical protein
MEVFRAKTKGTDQRQPISARISERFGGLNLLESAMPAIHFGELMVRASLAKFVW